jgi:hypothetical protein
VEAEILVIGSKVKGIGDTMDKGTLPVQFLLQDHFLDLFPFSSMPVSPGLSGEA